MGDVLRVFDGYTASYDTRLRNPRWVLERITKESSKGDGNRTNATFLEDQDIDAKFRAKLSDFQGSGYDRGHMTPAANHKGSQNNMADTFVLTNISPQVGRGFNRFVAPLFKIESQLAHASAVALHRTLQLAYMVKSTFNL